MQSARYIAIFIVLLTSNAFGQSKVQEIELLHADKFTVDQYTPKGANKLKGHVRLKHQDALMFCDSALLFDNNSVKAEGNVRIVENDLLTLVGDSLFYDGNTKIAKFRSNVIIDNGSSTLKTDFLDYNRETKVGAYYNGGEIDSKQEGIHLTSKRGQYFTESRVFHYKTDVVMKHPDYTIMTDTMHYSSDREKTWFFGPTNIEFDNRKIYCEFGWFDQLANEAHFVGNAEILSSGQILRGDTIEYDETKQIGVSKCNVVLIDTGQKFEVNGDYAIYYEADSISYVTDNMLMKQDMSGDTFFLVADTLHSYVDSLTHDRIIRTYHRTRFFKNDMQGQCDSLIYQTKDSIIYLYTDPIIWSENNQITADSIRLTMSKGTMDKMYMNQRAFIISHEDSIFYNQIKGLDMIGYFQGASLNRVDVFGNGQTVYYPREEDQTLIGVNETKCSNMTIKIDSNRIQSISFYDRPTATITPSDDMPVGGAKLDNFRWRISERPGSVEDLVLGTSSPMLPKKPTRKQSDPKPVIVVESNDSLSTRTDPDSVKQTATDQKATEEAIEIDPAPEKKPSKGGKTRSGAKARTNAESTKPE